MKLYDDGKLLPRTNDYYWPRHDFDAIAAAPKGRLIHCVAARARIAERINEIRPAELDNQVLEHPWPTNDPLYQLGRRAGIEEGSRNRSSDVHRHREGLIPRCPTPWTATRASSALPLVVRDVRVLSTTRR